MKRIDIKEFREKGYLQELNRQFLHPLGLALEVVVDDEDGSQKLGGIWDYRDDPEGIYYNIKESDSERIDRFIKNKEFIENELKERSKIRRKTLGFVVEEVNFQNGER